MNYLSICLGSTNFVHCCFRLFIVFEVFIKHHNGLNWARCFQSMKPVGIVCFIRTWVIEVPFSILFTDLIGVLAAPVAFTTLSVTYKRNIPLRCSEVACHPSHRHLLAFWTGQRRFKRELHTTVVNYPAKKNLVLCLFWRLPFTSVNYLRVSYALC